ncbi:MULTISPECIES: response regulator [Dyadobacter]|uniref:Response regulator n=1 Tax=Dyadobacter chenhuakuii TaxID=2909339 RepID=A0A9X1QHN8_9BACT|nr:MULTISPECIES: response regulator [Dyadobacter]MCE7070572.1 response regulator [Dyadobacter sp. CY327]MCF2501246.1 response regulator [Dyadobacter chenhuakuii]
MKHLDESRDLSILVVDDNHDQATITAMFLKMHGFKVVTRSNGRECMEATEELKPDVIITDIDMPIMDGITACNLIREQDWGKHIAIIAISGNIEKLTGNPIQLSCFDAHFLKPDQYDYLVNTIWKTVNARN